MSTHAKLKNGVAIVTGAARGLGLLIADDLASEGMHIAALDVRGQELTEKLTEIGKRHEVETEAFAANVADESAVANVVKQVLRRWGRIDVLINNAGVRQVAPVWETSTEMWDCIHNSNLKGQFLCTREVLTQDMLRRGEGCIIFISSGSGKKGEENSSAYCASKWGILGFSESVAKDLKNTRIRVTALTPGMILTPMAEESEVWHLGLQWLDPKQVSRAVIFCVKQDPDTIIPELRIYHRAQV